jgi:hypothetical protein
MEAEDYQEMAVEALLGIITAEHAVIWSEVEARASERPWGELTHKVDPHHLTTARRMLMDERSIEATLAPTKGGHQIETLSLVGAPRRAVEAAAARKRLLHGRFMGWALGTKRYPRGLIGGAGESVAHASLAAAAGTGYGLFDRVRGDVAELYGAAIPGGSLDNGAHLIMKGADGVPTGVVSVLVEVKNIREWLYPNSTEVYQLLAKASKLQVAHPEMRFLPVLVCRRAHYTLFRMAKQLGFYVVALSRQFITQTSTVSDEALREVRSELGFADLIAQTDADDLLVKHFTTYIPREAAAFSERWAITSQALGEFFPVLRRHVDPADRAKLLNRLRKQADKEHGTRGGW